MKCFNWKKKTGICIGFFFLLASTVFTTQRAFAAPATLYVSDDLKTALRTGPSVNHRILAFLSSGTRLNVVNTETEWVEVMVAGSDKQGWVKQQFTQTSRGARTLLSERNAVIEKLNAEIAQLKTTLAETSELGKNAENSLADLSAQLSGLQQEHEALEAISKEAVSNHGRVQGMREQIASLQTELGELEIANALLRQDNYNRGIIHALMAVVLGIVLAIILPRLSSRSRRNNRWD